MPNLPVDLHGFRSQNQTAIAAQMGQYALVDESPTAEDDASIDNAGVAFHRMGWGKRFSLDDVIDEWASLVSTVENGYSMTIDDYTNDVSIREWPEQARPMLTERVIRSMDERLAVLDARFRNATEPVLIRLPGAGDQRWARRLPKVLVDELAEDVDRMGLRTR